MIYGDLLSACTLRGRKSRRVKAYLLTHNAIKATWLKYCHFAEIDECRILVRAGS
jgi:hypothetical protein